MKGTQGVVLAVCLGLAGGLVNWFYLSGEAQKIDMVSFVGIKPGIVVGRSEVLKADRLVELKIPKNMVGNLKQYAFTWDERNTVKDRPTWRTIDSNTTGGTLLFRSDVQTPPAELELGKDERAVAVPIDPKMVVLDNIKPGGWVTFRVPIAASLSMPTPASRPITAPSPAPPAAGSTNITSSSPPPNGSFESPAPDQQLQPEAEKSNSLPPTTPEEIGPFKVLSVGNRLGDAAVMRAAKIPQKQENVLEIRVSKKEAGEEKLFDKLWTRLEAIGFHGVGVIIEGPKK